MTITPTGSSVSVWNISYLNDCIYTLFDSCFACYAAEFIHSSNSCRGYYQDVRSFPSEVDINKSSEHQTLILKKTHRGWLFSKLNINYPKTVKFPFPKFVFIIHQKLFIFIFYFICVVRQSFSHMITSNFH